jgi:CheY-like chemotaxis protein
MPNCRVLLVEDNRETRQSLRLILEAWGYQVEEAADGAEGLRKAIAWRPDVVLVDIGLPVFDGYELARRVKALNKVVPLVALTAHGELADCQQAFHAGFAHHLTKPANPDDLRAILDEYAVRLGS